MNVRPEVGSMNNELHWLSIADLSTLLAGREVSSVEVTEATLRRIEETEPAVHAYAGVMAETALEDAARADDDRTRGVERGPLHGVPIGVKDLLYTAGFPTT